MGRRLVPILLALACSAGAGAARAEAIPVNVTPPTVTGDAVEGQTLAAGAGTWSGQVSSVSYQWQLCTAQGTGCGSWSGATQTTFHLRAQDVGWTMRLVETAHDSNGNDVSAPSAVTPVIAAAPPPTNTALPAISGPAQWNSTLITDDGSWSGPVARFDYQWERCDTQGQNCTDIDGEVWNVYGPLGADVGSTLRVVVTATNGGGSTSATSDPTSVVTNPDPPVNVQPAVIEGDAVVGSTLTELYDAWEPSVDDYRYQWERCDSSGGSCVDIDGTTDYQYVPVADDVGSTLRVVVRVYDVAGQTASTTSDPTPVVTTGP